MNRIPFDRAPIIGQQIHVCPKGHANKIGIQVVQIHGKTVKPLPRMLYICSDCLKEMVEKYAQTDPEDAGVGAE